MSDIVALNFEQADVRIVHKAGHPWFVAKDVCGVLGLGNVHHAIAGLSDDERQLEILTTPSGSQEMAIISEPGLYSLLARSRKPIAKKFDRWVRHEVLPSLRKDGFYSMHGEGNPLLERIVAVAEQNAATMLSLSERSIHHEKKLDELGYDVSEVKGKVGLIEANVADIQSRLPRTRRISKADRDWVIMMASKMGGVDPLDPLRPLFDGSGRFVGEIDHVDDNPHNNKRVNLWPLNKDTHRRKTYGEFSTAEVKAAADSWHAKAKRIEPLQGQLNLG